VSGNGNYGEKKKLMGDCKIDSSPAATRRNTKQTRKSEAAEQRNFSQAKWKHMD
jgi:hypothetical protein